MGVMGKVVAVILLFTFVVGAFPVSFAGANTEVFDDTVLLIDGQPAESNGTGTGETTDFEFAIDGESDDSEAVTDPVYIIDGYKYECVDNNDGGWNCDVGLAGWEIRAYNLNSETEAYISATTDAAGYYRLTVGEGDWEVAEVSQKYWYQVATFVNNDSIENLVCDFAFFNGELVLDKLAEEAFFKEADAHCSFGNWKPTYKVSGVKWDDRNSNGVQDEAEAGIAGWTISAKDQDENGALLSTTTDATGYYEFDLALEGNWKVSEEMRADWNQVAVVQNGEVVQATDSVRSCEFDYNTDEITEIDKSSETLTDAEVVMDELDDMDSDVEGSLECSFYNHEQPRRSGGSSSGTRVKERATPTPQVLGASTTVPACGMYLTDYLRMGKETSSTEVTKLQVFLNAVGVKLEVTGAFDAPTDAAVRAFQAKYKSEVLTPWYLAKIVPHENPTGWVYQLTRWKINNIVCPGSEAYPTLN